MKITSSRALFGILLGVVGGIGFGLLARILAERVIRTAYNGIYYIGNGSVPPLLAVAIGGLIAGILVPMVNKRLMRLAVGAAVSTLGTVIFLLLPFIYVNLLVPGAMVGVCCLISACGGVVQGGIAAWVDFP